MEHFYTPRLDLDWQSVLHQFADIVHLVWIKKLYWHKQFVICYIFHRISGSKTVEVYGDILGVEVLEFWINGRMSHNETVYVIMSDRALNDLFTLIMILMVVVNTINMGAQLDIEIIKQVFRKPIGPFVGFVCQFGFMPLFSYFIGWAITDDMLFRL